MRLESHRERKPYQVPGHQYSNNIISYRTLPDGKQRISYSTANYTRKVRYNTRKSLARATRPATGQCCLWPHEFVRTKCRHSRFPDNKLVLGNRRPGIRGRLDRGPKDECLVTHEEEDCAQEDDTTTEVSWACSMVLLPPMPGQGLIMYWILGS